MQRPMVPHHNHRNTMGVICEWELKSFHSRASEVQGTAWIYMLQGPCFTKWKLTQKNNCNSSGNMTRVNSCRKQSKKDQHYTKCIASFVFLLCLCVSSELIIFSQRVLGIARKWQCQHAVSGAKHLEGDWRHLQPDPLQVSKMSYLIHHGIWLPEEQRRVQGKRGL